MSTSGSTHELKALAQTALAHQNAGQYAMAAQEYAALLEHAPNMWSACYNLALVYQHLQRLPEAAEMYARTVRLNPRLAEGYNNLGNVLKAMNNQQAAIEAFQQALALNPGLSQAAYNLANMMQARNQFAASVDVLRQAVANDSSHGNAWDALYRGLLGLGRQQEAIQTFIEWEKHAEVSPEMIVAGLALCRLMADRDRESRYVNLAISWPFAAFAPEQFAPVLGMIQYFSVSREELLRCYRRYDAAVSATQPRMVPLLTRRAAGPRLRIGYVSGDFRQHVLGRMMLDVIARHDREKFSIFLISSCARNQYDALTAEYRRIADGFADISELDDFAAAKSIAEADIDVLVDLAGHTNSARPGIYAHRPARTIVTHLGYHGCLGISAVDYKLTDRIADLVDAAAFQIERPFALETCVFPLPQSALLTSDAKPDHAIDLKGKFVFGAFLNLLKLSPHCLSLWSRVLDAAPDAMLLFSPINPADRIAIENITRVAGIDPSRIAILDAANDEESLRSRYRLVDAVMDTFPYAGGDTTLAALGMGVPVVTLAGSRQSERIGASILTHLGIGELVADSDDAFVALSVRLSADAGFMADCRAKLHAAVENAAGSAGDYTRALEKAYAEMAGRSPVAANMSVTARQFFQALQDAMRRQAKADNDGERHAIAAIFHGLRVEQPDYPPLLRAQFELAKDLRDVPLASSCLSVLLERHPEDLEARLMFAGFVIDQGAAADALKVLEDASAAAGNHLRVLKLQVRAHAQLRQWEAALQHSETAIALAPADADCLFWHGTVLSHVGNIEAALAFLNRALILVPDHAEAAYNAGVLLAEMGNHVDAEKVFRRAMSAAAEPAAHLRLLQVLRLQHRRNDWLTEAKRFVEHYPGLDYSSFLESRIARHDGDLVRESAILLPLAERLLSLDDDIVVLELVGELLATLPYHDVSARLLKDLHERFTAAADALCEGPVAEAAATGPWPDRLRLGFVVDFSQRCIAETVTAIATNLDRNRFSIAIYALSPPNSVPSQLAKLPVKVVSMAGFDEHRSADTIRRDHIDVLIDNASYGAYAKPALLSFRPAVLQIGLPGFSQAVGIGNLDYRMSDRVLDLAMGEETARTAILVADEGPALPIVPAPAEFTKVTRTSIGIDGAAIVFGVLASVEQLSSRCVSLWKSLSERVPGAVFLLCPVDADDVASILKILTAGGIESGRLISLPGAFPGRADLELAGIVDIILDSLPGSDYRSVRAAILEGIPVVTLAGRTAGERIGLALLSQLGEAPTVAASGRDYVDIAARLATNADERTSLSGQMKRHWVELSCADGPLSMIAYTRRLETVISQAVDARMHTHIATEA